MENEPETLSQFIVWYLARIWDYGIIQNSTLGDAPFKIRDSEILG